MSKYGVKQCFCGNLEGDHWEVLKNGKAIPDMVYGEKEAAEEICQNLNEKTNIGVAYEELMEFFKSQEKNANELCDENRALKQQVATLKDSEALLGEAYSALEQYTYITEGMDKCCERDIYSTSKTLLNKISQLSKER